MRILRFFFAIALVWSQFSGSASAAFLGPAATDEGTFTAGTSPFQPNGCFFQTTGTSNPLTNGQQGTVQCTAQRAPFVNLRNSSGTEIGTSGNPLTDNVSQFGGTNISTGTGAGGAGIPRVTISNDSSLAANQSVNVNQIGGTGVVADACQTAIATHVTVNINTATTTNIISGTSAKKTYICSGMLLAAGADNVGVVEGTGATCGTSTAGVIGGTTAATGLNFAANQGAIWSGGRSNWHTNTNADNLCLITSAAVQLSGYLDYVQQ